MPRVESKFAIEYPRELNTKFDSILGPFFRASLLTVSLKLFLFVQVIGAANNSLILRTAADSEGISHWSGGSRDRIPILVRGC
jgi:hypothetical protein